MREQLGLAEEEIEELIQHSLYTLEGGQAAATALMERGCTAVVCASDMMALGAIRAARRESREVPRDLSVVGYDDSPLIAFTDPPLTTIRQPVTAMGQAAVRTLLEEIGGTPAPHSEFVFMPELVVRGSTASDPEAGRGSAARPEVQDVRPEPDRRMIVGRGSSMEDSLPMGETQVTALGRPVDGRHFTHRGRGGGPPTPRPHLGHREDRWRARVRSLRMPGRPGSGSQILLIAVQLLADSARAHMRSPSRRRRPCATRTGSGRRRSPWVSPSRKRSITRSIP